MQEKDAERIYKHILLNTPKITIKNIKNFHTGLLNEVIREFPDIVSRESILVVALITSMSWLGPEKDGKPPKRIWNDLLLNKIKSHNIKKESQINKVLEFVIAYGCGKWRRPEKGIGTKWEHIWPGARKALSSIVDVSIKKEINLWLKNTVIQFPLMSSIDVMYYVHYIVEKLLFPEYVLDLTEEEFLEIRNDSGGIYIRCGDKESDYISKGTKYTFSIITPNKIVSSPGKVLNLHKNERVIITPSYDIAYITLQRGIKKRIIKLSPDTHAFIKGPTILVKWECACGRNHCLSKHRLSEWEPKTNLLYFISSAIKGHRNKILTNSFIQGMYYPLLTIEVLPIMGKLKHDKIEYKSCHICATEYEGYSCLGETCNQYFNRKKDRKFDIDALILINIEPEIYKLVQRCRCSVCGNIYDLIEQDIIDASLCNICKNPLFNKDRLISLWHNTHTMLQKAKVVEKERKPLIKCEYCFKEIDNRCWCPICNENNIFDKGGCLPQRMVQLFSRNMFGQMKSDF